MVSELKPLASQNVKSFYNKAIIIENPFNMVGTFLRSYDTLILFRCGNGKLIRLYDDWSQTTGRHIKAFCGLNKKQFFELEFVHPSSEKFTKLVKDNEN